MSSHYASSMGSRGRSPSHARSLETVSDLGNLCLIAALSLFLSSTPCFSGVSARRDGSSTVSTVSTPSPTSEVLSDYTLDQVLEAIRSRNAKYRAIPLRIEYTRTVDIARRQPTQKTECTLVSHGDNFRNEVRDAKGRKGWQYRVNGVRAEVGRRWHGFDLLLPGNEADSEDVGERISYCAHDRGFSAGNVVALLVNGVESLRNTYFREAEKAGDLKITETEVNGTPCVQLSAGGAVLCLAPQYDWTIVRDGDLTARDFRRFGERVFPTTLERVTHLHDLQGHFFTYHETCKIRSVSQAEVPGPDFWKIPEPKPGTWVKVAYPRWNTKWEDELGSPVTRRMVLDCVRAEHAFAWPPTGKDARIDETSRHWRDRTKLDLALCSDGVHGGGCQFPLPFMSADGEQIVWATYEPARQRLSMFDPGRTNDRVEAQGMKFEASFVPERQEIRLGQPLSVTFYVTNTGTQTFYLETGGDSPGVRSDRFQFWAVTLEGIPAPDPYPNPGHFGGPQGPPPKVAPGDGYSEKLDLSRWVKFEQPGEYLVRGRRVIQLLTKQQVSTNYALVHPLLADFKLTVQAQDPNQVPTNGQSH